MGAKITGAEELLIRLQQVGDRAVRGVSKVLQEGAEDIAEKAKSYAPVDEGNLENAIYASSDRKGVNTRIVAYVRVNDESYAKGNRRVGDYALFMHEHYYTPGPKSSAKGPKVGRKYLERAAREERERIMIKARNKIREIL